MLKFKLKYGSGDIIIQPKSAELSFLYATLRVDLFYNPPCIIKIFVTVAELCSQNESVDIVIQPRSAELYATLRVDLFYNPTKYYQNILMVTELCPAARKGK